jgi:hypothetical protein
VGLRVPGLSAKPCPRGTSGQVRLGCRCGWSSGGWWTQPWRWVASGSCSASWERIAMPFSSLGGDQKAKFKHVSTGGLWLVQPGQCGTPWGTGVYACLPGTMGGYVLYIFTHIYTHVYDIYTYRQTPTCDGVTWSSFSNEMLLRKFLTGCWWLTPVIPASQETEIRRIVVQSQPGQKVLKTLSQKYPTQNRAGEVAQVWGPEFKL